MASLCSKRDQGNKPQDEKDQPDDPGQSEERQPDPLGMNVILNQDPKAIEDVEQKEDHEKHMGDLPGGASQVEDVKTEMDRTQMDDRNHQNEDP